MSNQRNVLTSLFHGICVAGPVRPRAFAGIGASALAGGSGPRASRMVALPVWLGALLAVLVFAVPPAAPAVASPGAFGPLSAQGLSLSAPAVSPGGGDPQFGEPGEGAGQIGSPRQGPSGGLEVVRGLAVNHATGTGDVYVADAVNRRVDEFEEDGTFVRAWGWGVDKSEPEAKLQECRTATGCQRGEAGGGAGEFSEPVGIAVDSEVGGEAVYVLEGGLHGNDRVQEFTPAGAFVTMWGGKVNEAGGNVCTAAEAVECRAGSEGSGDGEFSAVGRRGAIAVGPTGLVYVGDYRRVQWFSSAGKAEGSFSVTGMAEGHEIENVEALAVTSGGGVCLTVNPNTSYTQESAADEVLCYSATGTLEHTIALEEQKLERHTENLVWLAADGSGHLFVDQDVEIAPLRFVQAVYEYSETGQQLERLLPPGGEPGSKDGAPGGFALSESAGAASGVLVMSQDESVVRSEALPPPGPEVIAQEGVPGEPASSATLSATIDPEDHASEYHFEYGTEVGGLEFSELV